MKDRAILCNIGHFDNEIQVDALKKLSGMKLNPKFMKLHYQAIKG